MRIAWARANQTPTLVVVNAVLVLLLVVATLGGRTKAGEKPQPVNKPPVRARGEYTLLAPKSPSGNSGALLIVDSRNEEMAVLEWDKTRRQLTVMGYRDLSTDAMENIGR